MSALTVYILCSLSCALGFLLGAIWDSVGHAKDPTDGSHGGGS